MKSVPWVLGGVLLLSGCGDEAAEKKTVTATWTLKKADGTSDECPAHYDRVKVVAQGFSLSQDISTGDPFVQVLDCAAGSGGIDLPVGGDTEQAQGLSGRYAVTVWLTEASGEVDYLPSFSRMVDVSKGDTSPHFDLYPSASFRRFTWILHAQSSNENLSCEAAGVDSVKVYNRRILKPDGTPDTSGKVTVDTFPCNTATTAPANPPGVSSPLEFGTYDTKLELYSHGSRVGLQDWGAVQSEVKRDSLYSSGGLTDVYWTEMLSADIETR